MEKVSVIVAFGDIIGFGPWIKRALTDQEVKDNFMRAFFQELETFIVRHRIYLKYIGDGIMILKELPLRAHRRGEVIKFLHACAVLNSRIHHIIRECPWPSPKGFRVRVVSGPVKKYMAVCPVQATCSISKECPTGKKCAEGNKLRIPEYIGYAVNLSERLLSIKPDVPLMCHESVISLIGKTRNDIRFHHLAEIKDNRGGVDQEDLEGLYAFDLASHP